jgi:hypothetical protein
LFKELQNLNNVPEAKLFIADATSMYTNIDTTTAIQAFKNLFQTYNKYIPTSFPKELHLKSS